MRLGGMAAVVALLGAAAASPQGGAAPVPAKATPVTIGYSGTFDMTNTAIPQSTTSSYDFQVRWSYWWTGTWGKLFRDRARFTSDRLRFSKTTISGTMKVSVREKVDGPVIECALRIVKDPANPPTFTAAYDTADKKLSVNVEAPTFRGLKYEFIGNENPLCTGGPGVNVFGQPATFNPLGAGATVSLAKGGAKSYDRKWTWKHVFAGAAERRYDATIRSQVVVRYIPCRLVKGCRTT
jgi:hypothetical protein